MVDKAFSSKLHVAFPNCVNEASCWQELVEHGAVTGFLSSLRSVDTIQCIDKVPRFGGNCGNCHKYNTCHKKGKDFFIDQHCYSVDWPVRSKEKEKAGQI